MNNKGHYTDIVLYAFVPVFASSFQLNLDHNCNLEIYLMPPPTESRNYLFHRIRIFVYWGRATDKIYVWDLHI